MKKLLNRMMSDYNTYSQLVAFNLHYGADDGTLQWNKGCLKSVEDYMERLADIMGVKLRYDFVDDGGLSFSYLAVQIVEEV